MVTRVRLSNDRVFDTVALMIAATDLVENDNVTTLGYNAPNDGGGADYRIVAGGTGTNDNGSYHDLTNGLQAELIVNGAVNVKVFGATGDGATDDTAALQSAIAIEEPLYFGPGTFLFSLPLTQNLTKSVYWHGDGAELLYANAAHTEYAILLNDTIGVDIRIDDLTIDGAKQANKALEIINDTSNTTPSNVVTNELNITRVERLNTFTGGSALFIRGAFEYVTINGGSIKDCELPTGQGIAGSVGIVGIAVTFFSQSSYVKRFTLNGTLIEKVFSSDLTYEFDQDGVVYFAPGVTDIKIESDCIIMGGCQFINCYGRSIKTQVRNTVVRDCHFERDEGFASGVGNDEIGIQSGSGVVDSCSFSYKNNQVPSNVSSLGGFTGARNGGSVYNCEVKLESGTLLPAFFVPFPRSVVEPWSRMQIVGNRIFGEVEKFVDFLTNAEKAHITIADNYVSEISVEPTTSERALVYVRNSGGSPPHYAYVKISDNIYDGSQSVFLYRDGVSGTSMFASYSGDGNFGFIDEWDAFVNSGSGPRSIALAAKLTGFEDSSRKGYFGMQSAFVDNNDTATFNFRNANTSFIIFQSAFTNQAYALLSVSSSAFEILSGTNVSVGATTNPGVAGDFNIWRSDIGEISVQNLVGSGRDCSVWVFSPN